MVLQHLEEFQLIGKAEKMVSPYHEAYATIQAAMSYGLASVSSVCSEDGAIRTVIILSDVSPLYTANAQDHSTTLSGQQTRQRRLS